MVEGLGRRVHREVNRQERARDPAQRGGGHIGVRDGRHGKVGREVLPLLPDLLELTNVSDSWY